MARSSTAATRSTITAATAPPIRGMSPAPQSRPPSPPTPTSPVVVAAAKPKPAVEPAPASGQRPTHEQIGRRAYEIYLDRCQRGQPGSSQSDWAQAEAELKRG